ncbi:amidohydrolase family protein [Hyphomicrobiales bacterium]|nr:amidohydrolase family protein [Hyphomicrobiales bacterium]
MNQADLIIRNGTVIDGSGAQGRVSDILIKDGLIKKVGNLDDSYQSKKEIDASGYIVTPGFVDIHTHYDGQATWDNYLSPSSWHGVTTALMGNCGVGFAPVRDDDHDKLISLMEGVEDIPEVVLTEGLDWQWNTFSDYLNVLQNRSFDMDIGAQIPHGALRLYVMGQRGSDREVATEDDIKEMAKISAEAIDAGAIGFTTSRTIFHKTSKGELVPSFDAAGNELIKIAEEIGKTGKGVLQLVSDFLGGYEEFKMLEEMVKVSGRPLSITLAQTDGTKYGYKDLLRWIETSANNGFPIRAQAAGRPIGLMLGLNLTLNPFSGHPSYIKISHLSLDERVEIMKSEDFRNKILNENGSSDNGLVKSILRNMDNIYLLDKIPDYEPLKETSIGAMAEKSKKEINEFIYDILLRDNGNTLLYYPIGNYLDYSLEASLEMIKSEHSLLGLGDGGAHCATICDASFTTHMLTFWGRDRTRGEKLELPWIIKSYTQDNALAIGLKDRGVISEGMKADINIIDFDNLTLYSPELLYDLPAGGKRLVQKVDGYKYTIVSGSVTYKDGVSTGELPGRLIRA